MYAIDTNILIYAFDAHDKRKHAKAKQILMAAFNDEEKLIVTNQVLAEFVSAATTKLSPPLTTEELGRFLRSVEKSANWEILNYGVAEVNAAAKMQKHFWDSLIAATIKRTGATLLTENTKHFEHTGARTKNPFE